MKAFLRLERDHEYRQRVVPACRDSLTRSHARTAIGSTLDTLGDFVDVPRRIIEDVA